jgi:ABC-type transport system involved in Fe-S cluster assembly fused permease/ATPase subunit
MTDAALTAAGAQATTLSFQFHCRSAGEYRPSVLRILQPIVALVAGILILVIPRLLNIIVAVYLILVGLLGIGLFR